MNNYYKCLVVSADETIKVQNPRRNYAGLTFNSSYAHIYITLALCVYTVHARASASLPRVGLCLYLACFTPVAPVASL